MNVQHTTIDTLVHMDPEVVKVQRKVYEITAKILIKLYRVWSTQTEQELQLLRF